VQGVVTRWREALAHTVESSPRVSILFSGGLDSSLVANGARELTDVELVTVGTHGSPDLVSGEQAARVLELPWVHRTVSRADVERVFRSDADTLSKASRASRPVLIGTALALETSSHTRVLCGQGADELFLGYAHFSGLSGFDTERKREADLDRLVNLDWPLSCTLAERRQKDLRSPFLEPGFLNFARNLSVDRLQPEAGRKAVLRQAALALGLPESLAARPKKAFQYGSGIDRLVRTITKDS
jgi:asparagine synthase (glutamine-hydrolysing)